MVSLKMLSLLSLSLFGPREVAASPKPFVIVELFTSEGCSSCPAADRLLSEIVDVSYGDVDVIGLSFHVHYWDYIGWKDPYADPRFSSRQKTYANKLRSYQVYTPQMVVNGRYEFVGSDRSEWTSLLGSLRNEKPTYDFEVSKPVVEDDQIRFLVSSEENRPLLINVAVVERGLSQQVTRGENRGRKLSHDNVVRAYQIEAFQGGEKEWTMAIPADLDPEKSSLIVYFQEKRNYQIVGASHTKL